MNEDHIFRLKVGVANGFSFAIGGISPLILDPKIHNVRYGLREYPAWAWFAMPALAVCWGLSTYFLLGLKRLRLTLTSVCLVLFCIPPSIILLPEIPHLGFVSEIWVTFFFTFFAIWVHFQPISKKFLTDSNLLPEAKLERAKAEINLWRTIYITVLGGYLALLVGWFNSFRAFNENVTSIPEERFLLNISGTIWVICSSIWFVVGVLGETYRQIRRSMDLLEKIPAHGIHK